MATVFLAKDLRHDREVALKVLHQELAASLGPERFQREVKLAARLQHPHILTVLDSGEAAGQLWFTMPFVDGESLRDRLTREKQLPVEDAVRIATEVAKALDYAHRHGVIHRDIKPENILLTRDGDTLVADFGIARALGGEERLTETGLAIGTPSYMSPEQSTGESTLDARTDIYALGTVLYEMLAGEPPFTGPTAQAIIAKRMRGEVPDIRVTRNSVPRPIGEAISHALAPVPADRFATAAEFAKALGPGATTHLSAARPSTPAARPSAGGTTKPARKMPTGLALLVLGFLIGVGVLFAFRRGGHTGGTAAGTKVIAVLPFENQGDSAQEYFADGITDEIRGKLSALPGLEVIASGSMRGYKHSDKPLGQIASELGADYLLMARVRWAKNPDGSSQVQVSPELVALAGGKPVTKWQQAFDAALTNVFQVQAQIAEKVAGALDVALADSVSRQLAERPTANLPAYDAYLRGMQIFAVQGRNDLPGLRQAIAYFKQSVDLDSSFAPGWGQLARATALLYGNGVPDPALDSAARRAADRAVALAPDQVLGHLALGAYFNNVRNDLRSARKEFETALRIAPNNSYALRSMALITQSAGQLDSALTFARQAAQLDPRFVAGASRLSLILRNLRRTAEARVALDRAIQLAPSNIGVRENRVLIELTEGNLDSARALIRSAPPEIEHSALVAYFANYWDLFWVLEDADQRLLLTLTPADFDGDRAVWGIVRAQTLWLRGDQAKARAYADSARAAFAEHVRATPGDGQQMLFMGLAEAYMGKKAEAMRDGERGVAIAVQAQDATTGPYFQHVLARIYVLCGEQEKAIDLLEKLVKLPYDITPAWLRIDPNFAPLRGSPRFEKLIKSS